MKDNSEDGSRDSVSAQQPPAQATVHALSEPTRNPAGTSPQEGMAGADGEDEPVVKPISAEMQHFIGRQLRAVFDDVAKQPVPDRFLELMKQLDEKTAGR